MIVAISPGHASKSFHVARGPEFTHTFIHTFIHTCSHTCSHVNPYVQRESGSAVRSRIARRRPIEKRTYDHSTDEVPVDDFLEIRDGHAVVQDRRRRAQAGSEEARPASLVG